ncbi:RNA polymerase sigma factor [Kitasatospora sp. NBC_00458]|uniref:RNA polymerase sigma factor n=1 Tax=Kitasatospora sp. NBC_00458 TaxID=2903568 RepID=UPI002E1801FC
MIRATESSGSEAGTPVSLPLEFEAFYMENLRRALVYAVQRGLDLPSAEEVVSDAFLALYRRWDHVMTLANPAGYLFTTVRNAAINHFRRRQWEVPHDLQAGGKRVGPDIVEEPDHSRMEILQLIDQLPSRQAEIMRLIAAGIEYREIAQILILKESTVRVHVRAARMNLQRLLDDNSAV